MDANKNFSSLLLYYVKLMNKNCIMKFASKSIAYDSNKQVIFYAMLRLSITNL